MAKSTGNATDAELAEFRQAFEAAGGEWVDEPEGCFEVVLWLLLPTIFVALECAHHLVS